MSATLSEFLLARFAEDEANIDMRSVPHAALVQLAPGVQVWHTFGTPMTFDVVHGPHPQWVIKPDPGRIHTEYQAKRRIVALADELPDNAGGQVLRLLALPYASHRDYRDEWRL